MDTCRDRHEASYEEHDRARRVEKVCFQPPLTCACQHPSQVHFSCSASTTTVISGSLSTFASWCFQWCALCLACPSFLRARARRALPSLRLHCCHHTVGSSGACLCVGGGPPGRPASGRSIRMCSTWASCGPVGRRRARRSALCGVWRARACGPVRVCTWGAATALSIAALAVAGLAAAAIVVADAAASAAVCGGCRGSD